MQEFPVFNLLLPYLSYTEYTCKLPFYHADMAISADAQICMLIIFSLKAYIVHHNLPLPIHQHSTPKAFGHALPIFGVAYAFLTWASFKHLTHLLLCR